MISFDGEEHGMIHKPTKQDFAESMKAWNVAQIAWCFKMQAHDLRMTSTYNVVNIQPADVDVLADFFEAVGERLETICNNERGAE